MKGVFTYDVEKKVLTGTDFELGEMDTLRLPEGLTVIGAEAFAGGRL